MDSPVKRAAGAVGRSVGRTRKAATRAGAIWAGTRATVLTVSGFGCFTLAAWDVARPLGLLAAAVSCFTLEALSRGDRT